MLSWELLCENGMCCKQRFHGFAKEHREEIQGERATKRGRMRDLNCLRQSYTAQRFSSVRHYAASGTMRHQMDFPSYYKGAATHIRGIVWCVLLLTTLVGQEGIPCKSFSRIHAQSNVCAEGRSATT